MSNISNVDYEDVLKQTNEILIQLESLENQIGPKKGVLIADYIEKSRILLTAGKLDINKQKFSTYIIGKLSERNITVNTNGAFYKMFNDDEKGNQNNIDQKSINISSGQEKTIYEECSEQKTPKIKKKNKYTDHFNNINKCIESAYTLNDAFLEKYNFGVEEAQVNLRVKQQTGDKKEIDEARLKLKITQEQEKIIEDDIESSTLDILTILSTLELARENIDDRNKWSKYEKMIAQFLIAVGETKAELAKKLNYCSKYASIGIERDANITRYWKFLGKCLHCGVDIKDEKDLLIEKYLNGEKLNITDGILKGY